MRAAIYARYSSENQRPESITDQIYSCRKYATEHGWTVDDTLIFSDEAVSGAREDRTGLHEMMEAARGARFDALLVDDLSRLARNNLLMLTVIGDLHFLGIRLVSVADGLDSNQEQANFSIQLRGIANELFLTDLRKKVFEAWLARRIEGSSSVNELSDIALCRSGWGEETREGNLAPTALRWK